MPDIDGIGDIYAHWLDVVARLLVPTEPALPYDLIAEELLRSVPASGVSLSWWDAEGNYRFRIWPRETFPTDSPMWTDMAENIDTHPLLRWFLTTTSTAPQSIGRLPSSCTDQRSVGRWREWSRPWGIEQQMSLPLHNWGERHRAFVLARSEEDFDDHSLRLVRRLQPVLRGAQRQSDELARWQRGVMNRPTVERVAEVGLTGRELAVLSLLAEGLSAATIGRRLGIQLRTVHKHLERAYAKLRVNDRVSAVLKAQVLGLLGTSPKPSSEVALGGNGVAPAH